MRRGVHPAIREERTSLIRAIRRQARALGFSLAEIGDVLKGMSGDPPAPATRALLEDRMARVEAQMQGLADLRGLLQQRLTEVCALGPQPAPVAPRGSS